MVLEDDSTLVKMFNSFLSLFDFIPEYTLAVSVYLLGSLFLLWGWHRIAQHLPRTFGLTVGVFLFAILLTPTISEGPNAALAPAIFGLLFGLLTKEMPLIWINLSSIILVMGLGFLLLYCWSYYIKDRLEKQLQQHDKSSSDE